MKKYLQIQKGLQIRFPGLTAQIVDFKDVVVKKESYELEKFKELVNQKVRSRWCIEELREDPVFRAYRDFFWKLGIDPTKTRPAAEALIRRVLRGKPIPKINTWVDAYNLVSMETAIPIASFDADLLSGELIMRESKEGEKFFGIGMEKPVILKGSEVVIEDTRRLVAIYPYRDADHSKVNQKTRNVLMLMCGAPKITRKILNDSSIYAREILTRYCDGNSI